MVVIGPPGGGKSTIAWSLAALKGVPLLAMDALRQEHFAGWGFERTAWESAMRQGGAEAAHAYESSFELRLLREVLAQNPKLVDASGGLLLQYGPTAQARLDELFRDVDVYTVMAMPHPTDPTSACATLLRRVMDRGRQDPFVCEWLSNGGERLLERLCAVAMERLDECDLVIDTSTDVV